MSLRSEIKELINRLNQELNQLEQNTAEALNLVRLPLAQFPENTLLIQFFAYLSNILFFIEQYRQRIQRSITLLSDTSISVEAVQEIGEDLSAMLGDIIEATEEVNSLVRRLRG